MCLIKTHWLPKIAKEDIECRKKLYANNSEKKWYSPVMDEPYELGSNKECIKTAKFSFFATFFKKRIEKGIHSYQLQDYDSNFHYHEHFTNFGYKYYTAIIPKGTRYFIGYNGDLVSEKLIVKFD